MSFFDRVLVDLEALDVGPGPLIMQVELPEAPPTPEIVTVPPPVPKGE